MRRIGNLFNQISEFLANVYLDPFDHFVKEGLGERYYLRYMDDFVIFSNKKEHLKKLRFELEGFLTEQLNLCLKEKALLINQRIHGLSFLGARIFPNLIRIKRESLKRCLKKLKKRMNEREDGKVSDERFKQSLDSIMGYLSFFNSEELKREIFWGRCYRLQPCQTGRQLEQQTAEHAGSES